MSNAREIKLRIKGINETKKITKAMKLISASKLKKAKQMHEATMPFFIRVQEKLGVPFSDICLIDDEPKNIESAKKLGMQTIWFESFDSLSGK